MTTDDELRALIALGEKAQPRPWTNVYNGAVTKNVCQQPPNSWGNELRLLLANCSMSGLYGTQNATYIVAAANLAPEIAAELIAAREEIRRLRRSLESIANLGLQVLPVDKRWGTAFAFAKDALKGGEE